MLVNSFIRMEFPMGDDCHRKISQPRFVACNDDTTQFFNHTADAYDLLPPKKTHHFIKTQTHHIFNNEPTDKFQFASNILKNQSLSFVDGNKHNYLFNLCRILNKMGVTKSEAEGYISTFYPLNQIHSNCITGPYSHYTNEFNTWNFQTQNSFENSFKVEQPPPVQDVEVEQPLIIQDEPEQTIISDNFDEIEISPFSPFGVILSVVEGRGAWSEEINILETFFASITLPQSIQLNNHIFIQDVPKFIDSHLATLKANSGNRIFESFFNRLYKLKSIVENLTFK